MSYEKIGEVDKGDQVYTMLSTELANRVIRLCNGTGNLTIKPDNLCTVEISDDQITLTFKMFKLVACDDEGNQSTFMIPAIKVATTAE